MPPDARFAAAPRRVNPDAFQQFFACQMFHNLAERAIPRPAFQASQKCEGPF
jgi:hypothetical protein